MITNKFSFKGALGKAHNIGGSKCFSIPNTIDVPTQYSIDTDIPSIADFLTCSLDGRLWIFRRSRRYYVAVLRWDEDTEKLVFVGTNILGNESLINRGVDWILTDKSFIQTLDNEPYFSRIEYDSNDTAYIDTINQSYSFFPELEAWQQIVNGLHIQGSPDDLYEYISQSKITPLEFHYYSDNDFQVFSDSYPKLCYCNGILYAKGKAHIGKVYLLPQSFNENWDIEDFYLYICPDHKRNYDSENQTFNDNDGWDNLILAPLNENSACFFTPEQEDYGFCKKALNAQVTSLPLLETLDFNDNNGAIFFDYLTQSNLFLNDSGASLLFDNIKYECKGLRQWLAPAGYVNAVNKNFIIASTDDFSLAIHLDSAFFREKLQTQSLPLTSRSYSGKCLAIGVYNKNNHRVFNINDLPSCENVHELISWKNIYKHVAMIKIMKNSSIGKRVSPIYCAYKENETDISTLKQKYPTPIFIFEETIQDTPYYTAGVSEGLGIWGMYRVYPSSTKGVESYNAKLRYIDPETGDFSPEINISFALPNNISTAKYTYIDIEHWEKNFGTGIETFRLKTCTSQDEAFTPGTVLYDSCKIYVYNGKIGLLCQYREYISVAHITPIAPLDTDIEVAPGETVTFWANEPGDINSYFSFLPIMDVPEAIKPYIPDVNFSLEEQCGLFLNDYINNKGAVFSNQFYEINHYCITDIRGNMAYFDNPLFLNFPNSECNIHNLPICNKNIHVMFWTINKWDKTEYFAVYFSDFHPEIVDFEF